MDKPVTEGVCGEDEEDRILLFHLMVFERWNGNLDG